MKSIPLYRALCLTLATTLFSSHAYATEPNYWSHKDWRSFSDSNDSGQQECLAIGGEEGGNMFVVKANRGGNVHFYYQEITYRGMPVGLSESDNIIFRIERKEKPPVDYLDDVFVSIGITADGIPEAIASMPDGYAAEFIAQMRAADSITVLIDNTPDSAPKVVDQFSLSGFTANLLKISEWCQFDANNIATP